MKKLLNLSYIFIISFGTSFALDVPSKHEPVSQSNRLTTQSFDTIAFDVDEVLVIRNYFPKIVALVIEKPRLISILYSILRNSREFYRIYKQSDVDHMLDWLAQRNSILNAISKTGKSYKERIIEIACTGTRIQGTIDCMIELDRQGYNIVIASNIGRKTFDRLIKQGALPNLRYALIYTSDYTGKFLKKPSPHYYEALKMALEQNNLSYQKMVFTDDRLENVKSAKNTGIESIHFKNPEQLVKALHAFGMHAVPNEKR